jgi:hypothetical protein
MDVPLHDKIKAKITVQMAATLKLFLKKESSFFLRICQAETPSTKNPDKT